MDVEDGKKNRYPPHCFPDDLRLLELDDFYHHGSVLASIGLTIPAVLAIGLITHREVSLGLQGGNFPLLLLTLAVSVVTFTSGKTNILQGCIHLLLFMVFLLLIFCP